VLGTGKGRSPYRARAGKEPGIRADCLSPMRVTPLLLAAFLALLSSEEGFRVVSILKVLATIFFLPSSRGHSTD
jgi:hypothetical protein